MSFFKNNYDRSESASGSYLRLEPNETVTLRILTAPVEGLQVFDGKKPIRWSIEGEVPAQVANLEEKPRPFAALGVWHHEAGLAKIWVCTTKSVLLDLQNIVEIEGHPFEYDVQVIRKGAGLSTRYFTKVVNRSPAEDHVRAAAEHYATNVDLSKLYTGQNPFEAVQPKNTLTDATPQQHNSAAPF